MKKLISILCLGIAALSAKATDYKFASFIVDGQWLVVSNNVAVSNNTPNVYYFSDFSRTNVQTFVTTNTQGGTNGQWEGDIDLNPLRDGGVNTNIAFMVVLNDTNYTAPAFQQTFNGYPLGYTNSPAPVFTLTTAATNNVTFVLQKSSGLRRFDTTNTWSFSLQVQGTTPVVVATNMPSGFLAGAHRLRLFKISNDNAASSPGTLVSQAGIGQWVP